MKVFIAGSDGAEFLNGINILESIRARLVVYPTIKSRQDLTPYEVYSKKKVKKNVRKQTTVSE